MFTLMITYFITGLFLALISLPLYFGKIPPNGLYGLRVKKTMENPDIWYKVNKYSSAWLIAIGLLTAFAALGFYFVPGLSLDVYALSCLGIFIAVFVIGIVFIARYLKTL